MPKIRSIIEYSNFVVLFFLYVLAMEGLVDSRMNKREMAFVVYALGKLSTERIAAAVAQDTAYKAAFSLDKLAAVRERGVKGELDA